MTLLCVLLSAVNIFLQAFVFQLWWNWIMAAKYEWASIGYWQAFGLGLCISVVAMNGAGRAENAAGDARHHLALLSSLLLLIPIGWVAQMVWQVGA